MARKSRKSFNLRPVRIAVSAAPGALATLDVISQDLIPVATNRYRVTSLSLAFTWGGKAIADDTLEFGVAHGDYTAAEIEECLEASGSINAGTKDQQEKANRLVRSIGIVAGGVGDAASQGAPFNNGRPVKVKLNWTIQIGDTLSIWMRNGSAVVYTTGSVLAVIGKAWVTP